MSNTITQNQNNTLKETASGGDAQKSMGVKGKKKKAKKANPAKDELISLSQYAKQYREVKIAHAESLDEANFWVSQTINDILIMLYIKDSGAEEFKSFNQWKEAGYSVKKGSKSYRVWGRPIKAKHAEEMQKTDVEEDEKSGYQYFPMACLFSDLQVEKADVDSDCNEVSSAVPAVDLSPVAAPANKPVAEVVKPAEVGNKKQADKFRAMAENMQSKIDNCFAERQENTAKRINQAATARQEGYRLQRTQAALYALADLHEAGMVPVELATIKNKKQVYDLVAMKKELTANGFHAYYIETDEPKHDSAEAKALFALINANGELADNAKVEAQRKRENDLQFANIPGYFPTPEPVIEQLIEAVGCGIRLGCKALEPQAGSGAIAQALLNIDGLQLDTYEINHTLCQLLADKNIPVEQADFLSVEPRAEYDYVLMNPPFESLQDIDHVLHAYKFLKEGGVLAAVMSPAPFFRNTKKAENFRTWFIERDGYKEDLPEGSFKDSGTNVNTVFVVITKPFSGEDGRDDDEPNPFVCEDYENKQEARRERYEDRATKAAKESTARWERGREMASVIPFGQPVLVGHHSERRDRAYRNKIDKQFRTSMALHEKADYNSSKAEAVGTGGIASDDPEAITKLKAQLLELEQRQTLMKAANKALRAGDDETLAALGFSEAEIASMKEPDCFGGVGFASYELTNNNANIRRIKKRIGELEQLRNQAPEEFECEYFKMFVDDGRVHFKFDGKPEDAVRDILKRWSFKWSRYSKTWVRKATANGLGAGRGAKTELLEYFQGAGEPVPVDGKRPPLNLEGRHPHELSDIIMSVRLHRQEPEDEHFKTSALGHCGIPLTDSLELADKIAAFEDSGYSMDEIAEAAQQQLLQVLEAADSEQR